MFSLIEWLHLIKGKHEFRTFFKMQLARTESLIKPSLLWKSQINSLQLAGHPWWVCGPHQGRDQMVTHSAEVVSDYSISALFLSASLDWSFQHTTLLAFIKTIPCLFQDCVIVSCVSQIWPTYGPVHLRTNDSLRSFPFNL